MANKGGKMDRVLVEEEESGEEKEEEEEEEVDYTRMLVDDKEEEEDEDEESESGESEEKVDYTQRVVKEVPAPIWKYMARSKLFNTRGVIQVEKLRVHLKGEGRVAPKHIKIIARQCQQIMEREKNLLEVEDPVTVVGDIHGQFYDLMKVLEIGGNPVLNKDVKYLFLGDYVDRGFFGCECITLLMAYKVVFPNRIFLLRGNHECRHMTEFFNFKKECLFKYDSSVYDQIMKTFDCLPIACLLNGRFFCVHGGISPDLKKVFHVNNFNRFKEPPSSGVFCDLIWADPMDENEERDNGHRYFVANKLRGCSFVFSYKAVSVFLKNNNLLSVIRAHEAQDEGYRLYKKSASTGFPTVICIFSCANYCDVYNNKGAIIRFKNNLMNIRQYNASDHPYYLPNFMSAFNWSMPFVIEKIMDSFNSILKLCIKDTGTGMTKKRKIGILKKIEAVARVGRVYSILRKEKENIFQLKGLYGGVLPTRLLMQGSEAIKNALTTQKLEKQTITERRPDLKKEYHTIDDKKEDIKEFGLDSTKSIESDDFDFNFDFDLDINTLGKDSPEIVLKSNLKNKLIKEMKDDKTSDDEV